MSRWKTMNRRRTRPNNRYNSNEPCNIIEKPTFPRVAVDDEVENIVVVV
jgi:hypothetical protein